MPTRWLQNSEEEEAKLLEMFRTSTVSKNVDEIFLTPAFEEEKRNKKKKKKPSSIAGGQFSFDDRSCDDKLEHEKSELDKSELDKSELDESELEKLEHGKLEHDRSDNDRSGNDRSDNDRSDHDRSDNDRSDHDRSDHEKLANVKSGDVECRGIESGDMRSRVESKVHNICELDILQINDNISKRAAENSMILTRESCVADGVFCISKDTAASDQIRHMKSNILPLTNKEEKEKDVYTNGIPAGGKTNEETKNRNLHNDAISVQSSSIMSDAQVSLTDDTSHDDNTPNETRKLSVQTEEVGRRKKVFRRRKTNYKKEKVEKENQKKEMKLEVEQEEEICHTDSDTKINVYKNDHDTSISSNLASSQASMDLPNSGDKVSLELKKSEKVSLQAKKSEPKLPENCIAEDWVEDSSQEMVTKTNLSPEDARCAFKDSSNKDNCTPIRKGILLKRNKSEGSFTSQSECSQKSGIMKKVSFSSVNSYVNLPELEQDANGNGNAAARRKRTAALRARNRRKRAQSHQVKKKHVALDSAEYAAYEGINHLDISNLLTVESEVNALTDEDNYDDDIEAYAFEESIESDNSDLSS